MRNLREIFIYFGELSVYNEDLDDEDDSGQDWNEVEDEEDDEIDSDGKKIRNSLQIYQIKIANFC